MSNFGGTFGKNRKNDSHDGDSFFERANNQDFAKKPVDKSKTNKTLNFGNDGYPKIKSSISDIVDDKDIEAIYRNSRQPPGQSYNAFMGATSHQTMN